MLNDEPVAAGARWIRAALQVNPFSYKGANSPSASYPDDSSYNAALIAECEALGVELIAVTDHRSVDSAESLISAAADSTVKALPGFEANTSEGIHLLVLFEVGTEASVVNGAIGGCGVRPGCDNGTPGEPYATIMQRMTELGALVIPAHANVGNTGLLNARAGKSLEAMLKRGELHAIATSPGLPPATLQADVLSLRKPYDRMYPLAEIYADDICHPSSLGKVGATTWFKVSEPSLAAVKHSVCIPATRVRTEEPEQSRRVIFREISWSGGFLDGVTVPLAEDLTAFIGGRGTGKSSVIESLRYVLDETPIGESALRDHQAVVDHALQSGTSVRLLVDAISPRQGQYTIMRTVSDPPVVIDASERRTELKPSDVVGKIEIFGQHELAEVAQQKTSVATMIESFAEVFDPTNTQADLRRELKTSRDQLAGAEEEKGRLEEDLGDIPRLEAAVEQYEASDLPAQLRQQTRLNQDQATFTEARARLDLASSSVADFNSSDIVNQLAQEYKEVDDSPRVDLLRRAEAATAKLSKEIADARRTLMAAIDSASAEIKAAEGDWKVAVAPQRGEHAEVVRKLKAEGHDPDRYLHVTSTLGELKSKAPRVSSADMLISQLKDQRLELLDRLERFEATRRQNLNLAIRQANEATGGAVLVKPTPSPDRDNITAVVASRVSGSRRALIDAVNVENFSPRSLVRAAREGRAQLKAKYGFTDAQISAIEAAGEPFFRELEEESVQQVVDVSLDVSVDGRRRDYRRLDELSKGQRATALLLLLFGASNSPLIIDQPEDDLDNRFVYDEVVERLRQVKGTRQIIVSTHNANVPVLGDAELIVTLEGDGRRGWRKAECTGSLDNEQVREVAERILEGGRAAFDARRHLYGF